MLTNKILLIYGEFTSLWKIEFKVFWIKIQIRLKYFVVVSIALVIFNHWFKIYLD